MESSLLKITETDRLVLSLDYLRRLLRRLERSYIMRISYNDLKLALDRLNMVADTKRQPNMMIQVDGKDVHFAYSTGMMVLFATVSDAAYNNDAQGKMVVNMDAFSKAVDMFKPYKSTRVSEIEIDREYDSNGLEIPNSLKFSGFKFITVNNVKKDERFEYDTPEYEEYQDIMDQILGLHDELGCGDSQHIEIAGVYERAIRWDSPDSSLKLKLYNSANIESTVITDKDFDVWNNDVLKKCMDNLKADKGKQVLLSAARNTGFVFNIASAMMFNIDAVYRLHCTGVYKDRPEHMTFSNTLVINSDQRDSIASLLGSSYEQNKIRVAVYQDTHSAKINCVPADDEDESSKTIWSLSYTIPEVVKSNVSAMNNYQAMKYTDAQCTVYTDTLMDILNSVTNALDKKDEATVKAKIEVTRDKAGQESAKLKFVDIKSVGSNSANKLDLNIQKFRARDGFEEVFSNNSDDNSYCLGISMNLKSLTNIAKLIKTDYCALDIHVDGAETNRVVTIRLSEIDTARQVKNVKDYVAKYKEEHPDEDFNSGMIDNNTMLELRDRALGVSGLMQAKCVEVK